MNYKILMLISHLASNKKYHISKKQVYDFYKILTKKKLDIFKDNLEKEIESSKFNNILKILKNKEELKEIMLFVDENITQIKKNKINIISIEDINYPKSFLEISNPPLVIYTLGNFNYEEVFKNSVAIVGSRKMTYEGKQFCESIAKIVSDLKFFNISGLALGIDTIGHKNCIKNTGAILGFGLLSEIYPRENKNLAEDIIKNGGFLLSEAMPLEKVTKKALIDRNRLISALAKYVIIIEIQLKSGTFHTFKYAKKQKKNILVYYKNKDFINKYSNNVKIISKPCEILEYLSKINSKQESIVWS